MTFSDEVLTAYVDGELDAETRSAVERAMASDPDIAGRIARHRSLRQALRAAYDPVLGEPVPDRLLTAARAAPEGAPPPRATVVPLRGARAPRRWTVREWAAIAASLILGAVVSPIAFRSFDAAPLSTSGGRLVASGALASALSDQLASGQPPDADVRLGVTFVAKSGSYCRTFTLREPNDLAGLACRNGRDWQLEVLAKRGAQPADGGLYRQAGSSIPPAILETMAAEIAGDPLDARAEAAARADGWKR